MLYPLSYGGDMDRFVAALRGPSPLDRHETAGDSQVSITGERPEIHLRCGVSHENVKVS